jgi:hypothetical protein
MKINLINNHEDRIMGVNVNATINEHRAPTDESVKLLNEMRQQSLDNVIAKISNDENNDFKYDIFIVDYYDASISNKYLMIIKVKINGKEYERKVKIKKNIGLMISNLTKKDCSISVKGEVQNYLFLQFSMLMTGILLDNVKPIEKMFQILDQNGFDFMVMEAGGLEDGL